MTGRSFLQNYVEYGYNTLQTKEKFPLVVTLNHIFVSFHSK